MNNKKVFTIFGFMVLLFIAIFGYFMYISLNKNKNTYNINKNNISIKVTDEIANKLINIIDNEIYIINKYKSLNELTNNDKLYISFNKLELNKYLSYTYKEIEYKICYNGNDLINNFKNSSLGNLTIKNDSFKIDNYNITYLRSLDIYCSDILIDKDILKYNVSSYIEKISFENNKYKVLVKYLWTSNKDNNVYGSYTNLLNKTNIIDNKNNIVDYDSYLKSNYYLLKDKLTTYTYIFTKDNDNYILIDYYYE